MKKIYVASSWRNEFQPAVVDCLRKAGHEVYDFRNPGPGDNGFGWSQIDRGWKSWTTAEYKKALQHPIAEAGFQKDARAMSDAHEFCLVLPCGRSAHLEAGWAMGRGVPTSVLIPPNTGIEPELMYLLGSRPWRTIDIIICSTMNEVLSFHAQDCQ